jgi:glutaminyl-tRNA synthetase
METPNSRDDAGSRAHPPAGAAPLDFIRQIVSDDLAAGKNGGRLQTRFPPEPNGYLHIGHAKAVSINFGIAAEFGGACNLRFDDTNPEKEEVEFVESIMEDIRWLGFRWQGEPRYASDYFEQLYLWAEAMVAAGAAYVDDLSADEIREHRGTLTEPGRPSPFRDRAPEENLDLLRRMRAGEFADGSRVLRAKIDMASGNINLRDPVMYRIRRVPHHRTGDAWCLYPSYDWAHGQSDAIEGVTHSLCSLEFEDHRPLYDWFAGHIELPSVRPRQIEFARLNLTYTVMSKRKLRALVEEGHVSGWDDPRMPTLRGMRRRGYSPEGIRLFLERVGVAKRDSTVDFQLLEHCVREDLNRRAPRVMAVLRPVRLVIEDYPGDRVEEITLVNNPEDPSAGSRVVPFSRVLFMDRDDFREDPPKGYFRLSPGSEVRLRGAPIVRCTGIVKDSAGEIVEIRCTHDPESRTSGRRVKGASLRLALQRVRSGRRRVRGRLQVLPEPGLPRGPHGMQARAGTRGRRAGRRPAVRARRVLLRGCEGFEPRPSRVQQDRGPAGHLGQDRADSGRVRFVMEATAFARPPGIRADRRRGR